MFSNDSKLKDLSEQDINEIKAALPDLSEKDITKLYDLEVAKSTPRNDVMELLLADDNAGSEGEVEKPKEIKEGDFNPNKPYGMVWEKETKCILQGNIVFDAVTKEKKRTVK